MLQPLGIGTALQRLLNRHITKVFSGRFANHCLPFQFAIRVKGGINRLIITYLSSFPYLYQDKKQAWQSLKALISLDFTNMFNSISRKIVREELSTYFPDLLFLYNNLYPPEGNVVWFQKSDGTYYFLLQTDGFDQGDPLAPFFSCLALKPLLRSLQHKLQQRSLNSQLPSYFTGYIDDTTCISKLTNVYYIYNFIQQNGPPLG
jgi:hypothetical protein